MQRAYTYLVWLLLGWSSFSFKPEARKIEGRVTSFSESFPLEGVRVQVKGRDLVTGTMPDGSFSLGIEPGDQALLLSLAGYKTEEVKLDEKKSVYDISLQQQ
ncbi:MAG TPA: carboxypeptidase-like regulatory domain-containing protein [Flavihumibacter sp.]|nr:carboxypeptidase-like regulatory domain-containing protein [Bacteroidota bacterium]HOA37233.1 carboxypeptidase-like regulatory domain-containing protein [Flavihumibacter sp.]HPZ86956.1 carboxypeptidase-like regulatory domain-containing protein [Flavihumibacter sp.]